MCHAYATVALVAGGRMVECIIGGLFKSFVQLFAYHKDPDRHQRESDDN
jgi:hypothetical protein